MTALQDLWCRARSTVSPPSLPAFGLGRLFAITWRADLELTIHEVRLADRETLRIENTTIYRAKTTILGSKLAGQGVGVKKAYIAESEH